LNPTFGTELDESVNEDEAEDARFAVEFGRNGAVDDVVQRMRVIGRPWR
jgi:hypothetical protein